MNHRLTLSWRVWIIALVTIVPLALYMVPVHRLASRLAALGRARGTTPIDDIVADVDRWQHLLCWPWRSTCLKRASVLFALLRRGGIDVELYIGVKRDADKAFAAHAWLVREGMPYLESPGSSLSTYSLIARFPESPGIAA